MRNDSIKKMNLKRNHCTWFLFSSRFDWIFMWFQSEFSLLSFFFIHDIINSACTIVFEYRFSIWIWVQTLKCNACGLH